MINGNLIIGEDVGDGNVTLKDVRVKGDTIVQGGGMNTIIIEDSQISNLIIEKKDGKVRILAKGTTYINDTQMKSAGKLESDHKDASHYGYILIGENIASDEPIILKGNFESVEVKSGTNQMKVEGGRIRDFIIAKTAKDVKIDLAEEAKVDKMEINAKADIRGKGKIGIADINANDVTILVLVDKIETARGVDEPKTSQAKTSKPSKPSSGGSSGSSNGNDNIIESPGVDFDFDASTGTIKDYVGSEEDVVIPAMIGGVAVKTIGTDAFLEKNLKSVIIGSAVTTIEEGAFVDNKLKAVTIGKSVVTIGDFAFAYNKLSSVIIGNSVKTIGEGAFAYNELTSVKIGGSVKDIGPGAFNNNQLAENEAFIYGRNSNGTEDKTTLVSYGGAKRDHIKTPISAMVIGEGTFSDNPLTSVNIPNSVITIGRHAFADCEISSVIIGDSVVTIDDFAFGYNQLSSVKLPSSVAEIGEGAFSFNGSSNMSDNIEGTPYEGNWVLEANKWFNQDRRYHVSLEGDAVEETDYTITEIDDLTKVERGTELTIKALTDIIVNGEKIVTGGSKVISIKADMTIIINKFKEIPATGITLDITELELGLNEGNRKLIATVIPEGTTNKVVTWESSNNSVATVENGVVTPVAEGTATITASIGEFTATSKITVVTGTLTTPAEQFIFDASTGTIEKLKATYTKKDIVIPAKIDGTDVKVIGVGAFKERYIKTVIIPNTVIKIEDSAFHSNHLTSVEIPDSVTDIGDSAFSSNKLTSVEIPDSVTNIGVSAFSSNQLTSVIIPGNVTEIRISSFSNNLLTSVTIPNSVTDIHHSAFYINLLTEVTIPESVKSIGIFAFAENGPSKESKTIEGSPVAGTWKLVGKDWVKQ